LPIARRLRPRDSIAHTQTAPIPKPWKPAVAVCSQPKTVTQRFLLTTNLFGARITIKKCETLATAIPMAAATRTFERDANTVFGSDAVYFFFVDLSLPIDTQIRKITDDEMDESDGLAPIIRVPLQNSKRRT
jgi:hypothetical protein